MTRKHLGRGLDSLFPEPETAEGGVQQLPVHSVQPNPNQPRRHFASDPLQELAESIRLHGVLEPIIVRPVGKGYEIVVGERRWRASKLAGMATIPAFVRELSERDAMELALVENVQREDLNPVEEAEGYQRLLEEFGLTQEEIAGRVGKQRSTIANRLRLLSLQGKARRYLETQRLSPGHAKAILSVDGHSRRDQLAEHIVQHGLSVRQAEQLAKKWREKAVAPAPKPDRPQEDPHWVAFADEFRRVLGTKVNVVRRGEHSGRIEIEFYSSEDIERILAILRGAE